LGSGTYTAVAVQPSSLGNPRGSSETRTFVIDTSAPTVTIEHPASPSNDRTPSFSGTASEESLVHVYVYEGGSRVAELTATPSGGAWSTAPLAAPLPAGRHTYRVYASQESTIGNGSGR